MYNDTFTLVTKSMRKKHICHAYISINIPQIVDV